MKMLWEANHPYYCSEGNYFAADQHDTYSSWGDFLEEWDGSDLDQNLLFRWDWREGEDWNVPEGEARLFLFFMLQRKARNLSCEVAVSREDEPAIREWLSVRWKLLRLMWEPLP